MVQSVAATGLTDKTRLDAAFRNTVPNNFYGAPVNQYVTLQSQFSNGSGIGIQFNGDNAGLLSRNRVIGSYALDLSKGETRFRLGVGIGVMMNRINDNKSGFIRGDFNDPAIADYNQQRINIDGSIGAMMETSKGLQILASVPSLGNIQEFSKYSAVNYTLLNLLIKKKFKFSGSSNQSSQGFSGIEPVLGYRMMNGVKDVVDAGIKISYQDWIGFLAMYHSNNEYAFGVNLPYKDKLAFNFTYNTGKVYSTNYLNVGGTLEMHVMFRFGK
jgi:hypothetical protein